MLASDGPQSRGVKPTVILCVVAKFKIKSLVYKRHSSYLNESNIHVKMHIEQYILVRQYNYKENNLLP